MLKKAKADMAGDHTGHDADKPHAALDSSRQIWLAGLGAFSRVQALASTPRTKTCTSRVARIPRCHMRLAYR